MPRKRFFLVLVHIDFDMPETFLVDRVPGLGNCERVVDGNIVTYTQLAEQPDHSLTTRIRSLAAATLRAVASFIDGQQPAQA